VQCGIAKNEVGVVFGVAPEARAHSRVRGCSPSRGHEATGLSFGRKHDRFLRGVRHSQQSETSATGSARGFRCGSFGLVVREPCIGAESEANSPDVAEAGLPLGIILAVAA
jgi:hypothetical protein